MKSYFQKSNTLSTGLAMFSMFFGAGNVVFPLTVGLVAKDHAPLAILGLLVTAVGVPFLGLFAMTLFDGDSTRFFGRIGKWPALIVVAVIMGLIGPFGAIPRCIALSYSVLSAYLTSISLPIFSAFSCALIFFFTYKKSQLLEWLGYFLTPLLLISLGTLIAFGLYFKGPETHVSLDRQEFFFYGLKEGYQTMDLLGAFFICSVVLDCLKASIVKVENERLALSQMVYTTLKASFIGAFLLALVYIGFGLTASFQASNLEGVSQDHLISAIASHLLGDSGGIIACVIVALACLTTAIALAAIFSDFVLDQLGLSYNLSLIVTLLISFAVSTLDFTGIVKFLTPILVVIYPALIVLCICNVAYKLFGFSWVKTPFAISLALSLIHHLFL